MTTDAAQISWFALDVTLRVTVLLLVAGFVALCARRAPASFRSLVWSMAVLGALALPPLTLALPGCYLGVWAPEPEPGAQPARGAATTGRVSAPVVHTAPVRRSAPVRQIVGADGTGATVSATSRYARRTRAPA